MAQVGKKHREALERFDREKLYSPREALALVKQLAHASFDETVELHIKLGIDHRKQDQAIRGTVTLPHGSGKERKVIVFAQGEKAREAREAGATEVGDADLATRIEQGWDDFDVVMATPDMMPTVGKLGRILRAKMPNPKSGTVTTDLSRAIKDVMGGRIEYRNERNANNVHVIIGRVSFEEDALAENYLAVIDELNRAKPSTAKGKYIRSITLSSTMGPGVRVDPAMAREVEAAPQRSEVA